jgi:MFS superfamily sulfate permease-like transporter
MRFDLAEASGALGDLGTFVPLVAALVAVCDLDLGSILLFAGLYNILSGFIFHQPIPVQPMKAIAAVAIAETMAPESIAAAGLLAGGIVFVLGAAGLVRTAEKYIPSAVVRGIQLGVGLKLLVKGIDMIGPSNWQMLDGPGVAIVAAAFVLITSRRSRFPSALFLFLAGVVMMLLAKPELLDQIELGWGGLQFAIPASEYWQDGFLRGAVPQVPLTLLNSVIAVCALSGDLYPGRAIRTRKMAMSVGVMNIIGCWFGAMPMCHGSGGLAGQHRFGARTGGSVVILGTAKVLLAVLLGSSAMVLLSAYPLSILGVLLCFAGIELAMPASKATGGDAFFLALVTAGGCLGFNTAIGFALGMVCAILFAVRDRFTTA